MKCPRCDRDADPGAPCWWCGLEPPPTPDILSPRLKEAVLQPRKIFEPSQTPTKLSGLVEFGIISEEDAISIMSKENDK